MIKVRVDWQHQCLACGTSVLVDFINGSLPEVAGPRGVLMCPWCGCATTLDSAAADEELRRYLLDTARQMEEHANSRLAHR